MRHQDELRLLCHAAQHVRQAPHVRLVQRSIDLVEDAEGARLINKDSDQQRQRGQRLLATGEQQYILQLLAGRLRHNVDAAVRRALLIGQPHKRLATPEQLAKCRAEVFVDPRKSLVELRPRNFVDLFDRGLRVVDGVQQILALGLQKFVALGGLLVFLERHHVHRPHGFEPLLELPARLVLSHQRVALDPDQPSIPPQRHGVRAQVRDARFFGVAQIRRQRRSLISANAARLTQCIDLCPERLQLQLHHRCFSAQHDNLAMSVRRLLLGAVASFKQLLARSRQQLIFAQALLLLRVRCRQLLRNLRDPSLQLAMHPVDAGKRRLRAAAPFLEPCQFGGKLSRLLLR